MKTASISHLTSGRDIQILLTQDHKAEQTIQTVIDDLRAGRDIHIELTHFFLSFDIYNQQKQQAMTAKAELAKTIPGSESYYTLARSITEFERREAEIRADILQVALTLHRLADTEGVIPLKKKYEQGTLLATSDWLNSQELHRTQQQLEQLQQIDEQLTTLSHRFVTNSNEFLVKAQITQLQYELPDRYQQVINLYESGLTSANRSMDLAHLQFFTATVAAFFFYHLDHGRAITLYEESLELAEKLALTDQPFYDQQIIILLNKLGEIHVVRKEFSKGIDRYTRCLKLEKRWLETDFEQTFPERVRSYAGLGYLYRQIKSFTKSLKLYYKALNLFTPQSDLANGNSVARLIHLHSEIASLLTEINQMELAEDYYRKALDLCQVLRSLEWDGTDEVYSMSLNNMGYFFHQKTDFIQAISCLREAVDIFRDLAATNLQSYGLSLSLTLNNLGVIYETIGQYQEAENCHLASKQTVEPLARNNPLSFEANLSTVLNNLGVLYTNTNRLDEASSCLELALEIDLRQFAIHQDAFQAILSTTFDNLGLLAGKMGDYRAAENYLLRSLDLFEADLNDAGHEALLRRAISYGKLGDLYALQDRQMEAEQAYAQVWVITDTLLTGELEAYDDSLAQTFQNISVYYSQQTNFIQAEQYLVRALALRQKQAGKNPDTLNVRVIETKHDLGFLYQDLERLTEAEPLLNSALEGFKQLVAAGYEQYQRDLATVHSNLGLLYGAMNRIELAESHYLACLGINQQTKRADEQTFQINLARAHYNLTQFYRDIVLDKTKGLFHVRQCIDLLRPICLTSPQIQPYYQLALSIQDELSGQID